MVESYQAHTILAVDVGAVTTRALLFDLVEERHRFVGASEAPTTSEPPYLDVSEGMRHALDNLRDITGREFLDEAAHLIMPATSEGVGVDVFVATTSAGPDAHAVLVGLLPDVSLEDARLVAAASYFAVAEKLGLGDRRRDEQQIDAMLAAKPDVFIIAGGTDDGARDALLRLTETVGLACHLLPQDAKPHVLYVGNAALKDKIAAMLGDVAVVHAAPNVQPELGETGRVLAPARAELAKVFNEVRQAQVGGISTLAQSAGGYVLPTAYTEGQCLHYLRRALNLPHGALAVNVGAGATSVAAALTDELSLQVCPELGVGAHAPNVLADTPFDQLLRWLPFELPDGAEVMRDFIFNKSIHPRTIPAETNDLHLELALARQVLRAALRQARPGWPAAFRQAEHLPRLDILIGGGAVLTRLARPGLAALVLLDALEPVGFIKTMVLDEHHLLAALGAMAYFNPLAVAQTLEADPFLSLGPAVCAVGSARAGEVICRAKVVSETGVEAAADLKYGALEVLPLPLGQRGKLTLKPRAGIDVGFGPGRGTLRAVEVMGGVVGVILDGRGRPLTFPKVPAKRCEMVQQWLWKFTG